MPVSIPWSGSPTLIIYPSWILKWQFYAKEGLATCFVLGLKGLIVPIFPGLIVIWTLALLYGILSGFGTLGAVLFVIITALAILGEIADNLLMSEKARQEGARWLSIAIAFIAGIVCSIVFTPLIGIAATLGALFLAEYISSRDRRKALTVTKGMAIG